MMKIKMMTIFFLLFSHTFALSEKGMKCSVISANNSKSHFSSKFFARDKFKHCGISCVMANECGPLSSLALGVSKELYDIFGPGEAELTDLIANMMGIKFYSLGLGRDHNTCKLACLSVYPSISPRSLIFSN